MKKALLYIHGKGGNTEEAEHYKPFFNDYDVFGLDYKTATPWETREEILAVYDALCKKYDSVSIIANSIGAYFAMNALSGKKLERAFFISPIVNMEKLINTVKTHTRNIFLKYYVSSRGELISRLLKNQTGGDTK